VSIHLANARRLAAEVAAEVLSPPAAHAATIRVSIHLEALAAAAPQTSGYGLSAELAEKGERDTMATENRGRRMLPRNWPTLGGLERGHKLLARARVSADFGVLRSQARSLRVISSQASWPTRRRRPPLDEETGLI